MATDTLNLPSIRKVQFLVTSDELASEGITSGSAKSSVKNRIDSTPSLPPAKQNGLVTSNDSKPQSPEKSKRSTDVKTQPIPNISQKNTDDTPATRQPPTSPSKTKREDQLPSSPSKTKRDEKPPSSPSKVKRDGNPPSSPSKETRHSVEQSKSGKSTSSEINGNTVTSQSNKENTKPSQQSTQPTLVKENVQKNDGKFVASYTRSRPDRKSESTKTENNRERMDISPQSRTTEETTESNATKDSAYRWHAPARKYETPRNNRPVKPKAVTINSDTESSRTTGSSNKPPVLKLKLHKKPMYSRDKKAKEKEVVLTPRTQKSSVDSARPKSFHLERDRSIYRTNTYLWEDEKNELTYQPSTNTQTDVMMAYTGEPNTREALKSAGKQRKPPKEFTKAFTVFSMRSKQPPWHEKEYVLNRREAKIYQGIKQVYDKPTAKKARQREFLKKLEQFQIAMAKHQLNEMQQKETKKYMDKVRQANQLKELRQRFEDEAWHRFHTQYVTSRVLEHEKMNRFQYGLPEEPDGEPEFAVKLKRKKKNPQSVLTAKQLSQINKKKYSDMFDVNTGPKWSTNEKDPKMEGIDTVVLDVKDEDGRALIVRKEEGNIKEKKKFVKDVIQDAQKELQQTPGNGKNTGVTPRSPVVEDAPTIKTEQRAKTPDFYADESESDDDDDDMSDIFERARKKYNLEVDEEADSVSRASRVR